MKTMKRTLATMMVASLMVGTIGIAALAASTAPAKATKAAPAATTAKTTATAAKAPAAAPAATTTAPKFSQDDATKIALKAHQGSTLISVQLVGKIYQVTIQTPKAKHLVQVGSKSGKILKDTILAASTQKKAASK